MMFDPKSNWRNRGFTEIPYRGQPGLKKPGPRRQRRDLAGEKEQFAFTVFVFVLFAALVLIVGIANYLSTHSWLVLFATSVGALFLVFVIVSLFDANKKINKFRKGYDIDISNRPEVNEKKSRD